MGKATRMNQREQLAALQHEIRSDWVRHMFGGSTMNADGTVTIPQQYVKQYQVDKMTAILNRK